MALEITGDSGGPASQAKTQSPQTSAAAGTGSPAAASASSVQPGTADNLLKGPTGGEGGIPLAATNLPTVSLDTATQTATPTLPQAAKPRHHPNTVLLAIVVVLVLAAVVTMWLTQRSAKNTTD